MNLIKFKKKMHKDMMLTTALALTAPKLTLGSEIEEMLLKGRSWNSVLFASRKSQKAILNFFIKKLLKIITSKIRLLQIQKLIKLQKILAASLLFFKAKEIKMSLLSFSIWRVNFLLLRKNFKSFQLNRLSKIRIREFWRKLRKNSFQNKR